MSRFMIGRLNTFVPQSKQMNKKRLLSIFIISSISYASRAQNSMHLTLQEALIASLRVDTQLHPIED